MLFPHRIDTGKRLLEDFADSSSGNRLRPINESYLRGTGEMGDESLKSEYEEAIRHHPEYGAEVAAASPRLEDEFRRQVRAVRKAKGLTQAQLGERAEAFGFRADQTIIARIERGERGLGLDEAAALALALGMSLVDLIAGAPVPEPGTESSATVREREVENQARALRNAMAHMTATLAQANALVDAACGDGTMVRQAMEHVATVDPIIAAAMAYSRDLDEVKPIAEVDPIVAAAMHDPRKMDEGRRNTKRAKTAKQSTKEKAGNHG
jgi:transcriptional regulator with XRE-family HTH domain